MLKSAASGERQKVADAIQMLKAAPEGTDPGIFAEAFVPLFLKSTWRLSRHHQKLRAELIRAVLLRFEQGQSMQSVFLRASVDTSLDDAELQQAWAAGLVALLDMQTTYAWGSKQRKAKIARLAQQPKMVAALQAAAVGAKAVGLDALAVLAAEGSEASMDALLPHVERASNSPGGYLEVLTRLKVHAKHTPTLEAMFAKIDGTLSEKKAASKAIALARQIGLGELKDFWFDQWFSSTERTQNRVPHYQGTIRVQSTEQGWFSVSLSELPMSGFSAGYRGSYFTSELTRSDELSLGAPKPEELPQWLAAAAKKLKVEWDFGRGPRTLLRGKKRSLLAAWLRGEQPAGL